MGDNSGGLDPEFGEELRNRLPSTGDRLFVETLGGAVLDPLGLSAPGEQRSPIGRWGLYADGFLHAADRIVESWAGQPWEDELIYPILALYRHHLELQLKLVIRSSPGFTDELREWLYRTHELDKLWNKLEEVYPESHSWASRECTGACAEPLKELSEHDPKSMAAHYPVDRQERQTLEQLRAIDLRILKRGVHKISHYLGTIIESIHLERVAFRNRVLVALCRAEKASARA